MTTINDRHARAIARLIRDGHAATEDEAVDLLARLIMRFYSPGEVERMCRTRLSQLVALAKKGGAR